MREFLKKNLFLLIIFPVGVIADQVTKVIAKNQLSGGKVITIIKDWFYFQLTYNEGAAWGTMAGQRWLLTGISLLACILIGVYYFKGKNHLLTKVGLSMVFTGAFGNLIDRALFGKVIDFIDFNFFKIFNSYFPVFNVADMLVTCGAIVLMISFIFLEKDEKPKEHIVKKEESHEE